MSRRAHIPPQHHTAVETISSTNRSKVTNARLRGRVSTHALFVEADGRTPWARRYRDLVGLFCDDAGGLAFMTELKLALVRRCAALVVECERLENSLANGEEVDIDLLARLSSHMRRIAESIGLDKVRREIVPTLAELVTAHKAKPAAEKPAEPAKPVAATIPPPTSPALASDRAQLVVARAKPIEAAS
jgi:hypothetical protein